MKESFFVPETRKTLDNIKAGYLSSHIQHINSIQEIDKNVYLPYQELKHDFKKCVQIALPHLSTVGHSQGETVVEMESLNDSSHEIQIRGNGASVEMIKQICGCKTYFQPSSSSFVELYIDQHDSKNRSLRLIPIEHPIFNDDISDDGKLAHSIIQGDMDIYQRVSSASTLESVRKLLEEVYFQYAKREDMPGSVLDSVMVVEKRLRDYTEAVKDQKEIQGRIMNTKLKQFIDEVDYLNKGKRFSLRSETKGKEGWYVVGPNTNATNPIIRKDSSKYGLIAELKPVGFSELFDLALSAEDAIINRVFSEEEQFDIMNYLGQRMQTLYK